MIHLIQLKMITITIKKTSDQSDLTTGRITATHGRFNGIHQVMPVCTPTWHMLPLVHLSPNPKRHFDRFSRFCTTDSSESLYFTTGCPFPPLKLPLPIGDLDPHVIHGSFGPPKSSAKTASWSLQPFFHSSPQSVPILYNGPQLPPSTPSKWPLSMIPWAHPNPQLKQHAIFAGLTNVTDRPQDGL